MPRPSAVPALVVLLGLLVVACGGAGEPAAEASRRSGRTHGVDVWFAAAPGPSPDVVVLTFEGLDGEPGTRCEPEREVAVDARPDGVTATVRRYKPDAIDPCRRATRTIEARLPEPLGDRPLISGELGWRFVARDGRLELDPESTPCARADCSEPAAVPASCDPGDFDAIVSEQLGDRTATAEVVHCDGSFLVVDKGRFGWFVNRQAGWRLVTTGRTSCDPVFERTRIRFPSQACRPAS